MFEQQNLNGGKNIATNVRIAITAIAYYSNVMYKAKKIATYLCYIYVASY